VSGHAGGTVYFDTSRDRWVAQLDHGKSAAGSRRRIKRTAPTKAGAQRALRTIIAEQERRTLAVGSTKTLHEFARFYFRHEAPQHVRATTVATYEYLWNHYIRPTLGHRQLRDLTSMDIAAFVTDLTGQGLSVNTVRRARAVLHLVCAAAVRHDLLAANPVTRVKPPKVTPEQPTQVREPLTLAEARHLLQAADGHPLEAFLHLALATGLRRGEMLGLKWADIDVARGELVVRRTLVEGSRLLPDGTGVSAPTFNPPKTRNSARTIPIAQATINVLGRQRTRQGRDRLKAGTAWLETDLVFTNALGGALWPSNVYKQYRAFLRANGIRHVRIHDLRHTTAVLMLVNDVPLEQISQALGHATLEITKDIYARHVPELVGKATLAHAAVLYGDATVSTELTGTDGAAAPAGRRSRPPHWRGDQ
jgi:integrase